MKLNPSSDFKLAAAVDLARETCDYWGVKDFDEELKDHLHTGLVIAMPHLFAMAKVVELPDGRRAWLISHAVGNLQLLLNMAPFPLDWIALRRRFQREHRVYPMRRLTRLAMRLKPRQVKI